MKDMITLHPELTLTRFVPNISFGPWSARFMRRLVAAFRPRLPEGVTVEQREVPGPPGAPPITVRILRPKNLQAPVPALYWMHGGGFIMGHPIQDEIRSATLAKELGMIVVSVRYRLAPEHPYPAPIEDCYAGLLWLHNNAESIGVDATRIAIGGASAGGGLAAGLVLLARDRGVIKPAFQLLVYPMLDDRTTLRKDINARLWNPASNYFGWRSYLAKEPGGEEAPIYAAPARAADLTGLPPAWLGVGELDLFFDEDIAYTKRLQEQGIPCEVVIVPGAPHAFDEIATKANVSRSFLQSQASALRKALFVSHG